MAKLKQQLTEKAAELFDKTAYEKLWANPRGEFFSNENLAQNSLKNGEKLLLFEKSGKTQTPQKKSKSPKDDALEDDTLEDAFDETTDENSDETLEDAADETSDEITEDAAEDAAPEAAKAKAKAKAKVQSKTAKK